MANRVFLHGNLGKDPVLKHFQNDSCIAEFPLATKDGYKDKEGKWVEQTDWHNIKIPNKKMAELAEKYLKKGSAVLIEGKIKTRSYDDKDGNKRYVTEVVAERMEFTGGKQQHADGEPKDRARAEAENYPQQEDSAGGGTDDLPF